MNNELDIVLTEQELNELLHDLPDILRQLTADSNKAQTGKTQSGSWRAADPA
jgi:hypothetical protein